MSTHNITFFLDKVGMIPKTHLNMCFLVLSEDSTIGTRKRVNMPL